MSSRSERLGPRRQLIGLAVGLLALLLVVVAVVTSRGRSAGPVADGNPSYRENRVVVSDTFERTVDRGWGRADVGGQYTLVGEDDFAVANGVGTVALPRPGINRSATLTSVRLADLSVSIDVLAPQIPRRGSGVYVALRLRANGGHYYRGLLRFAPDRKVYFSFSRYDGKEDQGLALTAEKVVGSQVTRGQRIALTLGVSGVTPVQLAATVQTGSAAAVQVSTTDATASRLGGGGPLTLWASVAGGSDADKVVTVDNLEVRRLQRLGGIGAGGAEPGAGGDGAPRLGAAADQGAESGPTAGAAALGSTSYPIPAGALFVQPGGSRSGPGTLAEPYGSVQGAVDQAPSGTTVVLRAGSYHESVLLPVSKVVSLQSYPGERVWLDGSSRVSGWRRSGTVWEVPWTHVFDSSPTYTKGRKDLTDAGWTFVNAAFPMAAHPDQVWVAGASQIQVRSRRQVGDGRFFVDRQRRRLVLGTDPTSQTVRASTLSKGLTVVGAGDVVRGIGIRRYATSVWQLGAATVNNDHVGLENMVFSDNATTGLSVFASDVTLARLTSTRNGLMGIHANQADRLDVEDVWSSENNLEHFNRAPSAGGMKLTSSRQVRIANSEFADNEGHGLWFDASSVDVDVVGNRLARNTAAGVVVEISSRVRLVDNVIVDNGLNGIWVNDTDQVEIANNTIARNASANLMLVTDGRSHARPGLGGIDPRRPHDPEMVWVSRDVSVYNNVLADGGSCAVCVLDYTKSHTVADLNVRLDHNFYDQAGPATFSRWPSGGPKPHTLPDFAAYQEVTGQDRASLLGGRGARAVDRAGAVGDAVRTAAPSVARGLSATAVAAADAQPGLVQLGAWSS